LYFLSPAYELYKSFIIFATENNSFKKNIMQVKGTGIKTTKEFVKSNFPDLFQSWINALPEKSKALYKQTVEFSEWFPIREAYLDPVDKMIEICYNNKVKEGAEALGQFSAEYALKGIYKVFILVASPQFLMKRSTKIMTTFYEPCKIEVDETSKQSVNLRITKFDNLNTAIEYRIGAWCQKALEMANCKEVEYKIEKSLLRNDKETLISFKWN